jgi:ligand-binding SRPBCC domain-containing protein
MKVRVLKQSQQLPISLEHAWEFFSTPKNLDDITPPDLGFHTTYCSGEHLYDGQIICYRMRLAPLVNLRWVTEIQSVKPMESFIDNQIHGPYRLWHHLHRFEANEQGVLMTDLVHYALPFGPLGAIAHALYVRKKLERIFQFRKETLTAHFGGASPVFREEKMRGSKSGEKGGGAASSPSTPAGDACASHHPPKNADTIDPKNKKSRVINPL